MSVYRLLAAPFGSLCQSRAHPDRGPMHIAVRVAVVDLAPDVEATVYLCRECVDTLSGATDSAGG